MRSRIQSGDGQLSEYQQTLAERLVALLDRVDDDRVRSGSGLAGRKAGRQWALVWGWETYQRA